ncbi:MAG: DUF362 domain-containing protein [Candidatus Nanoarchaeia archaeon]|nr:DUF362 domain-containing protein [Candidatus Haiyanarchaeum thermophilum]MCW1307753.1 DUF362 domain-containing protein [Candidatus Haiyanarchaeum thermophilum]
MKKIESVLEKFNLLDQFNNKRVFIKPNLVSMEPFPTTTDPRVLDLLLNKLKKICKEILVGDLPAQRGIKIEEHPLVKVTRQHEVKFTNFLDTELSQITIDGESVKIYTLATTFDRIISLPVLKEHKVCRMTFSLKNNVGFVERDYRNLLHKNVSLLNRTIAVLSTFFKPSLVIGDASKIMVEAQEVRWGGRERELGFFFISNNPVELDIFASQFLNLSYQDVPYLIESIKIWGRKECVIKDVTEDFH